MRFLVLLLLFAPGAFAAPLFLHLAGQDPAASNGQIYNDMDKNILQPLLITGGAVLYSQVSQVYGTKNFFLNLIVEAADAAHPEALDKFVGSLEGGDFHGVPIHFQKVMRIDETAALEAGTYVDGRQDPFQQNFQLNVGISFSAFREWRDFTNGYGNALMAPDNATMMTYLEGLIGDQHEFTKFRDGALSVSNMMAIDPQVTLLLEDGTVSGPAFEQTPFLPFRFFRNCYSSKYEGGMCWKAAP